MPEQPRIYSHPCHSEASNSIIGVSHFDDQVKGEAFQ